MRAASILFWLGFAAFLALPVIGYQYYLKGLRQQSDGLSMGRDQIKKSINNDLQALTKRLDPNASTQDAADSAAGAGAKSQQLFEQMKKNQRVQMKKNPLLQK